MNCWKLWLVDKEDRAWPQRNSSADTPGRGTDIE